jgi:uncharacterized protein
MSDIGWWQWALAALGAFLVGLGKGGLPGVGNFTVLLFATAFEAKASVGLLLPVLISADVVAIIIYRRAVDWRVLWLLWPWMAVGVVLGTLLFDQMRSEDVGRAIGVIVLAMTALQVVRGYLQRRHPLLAAHLAPHNRYYAGTLGIVGGVATMLANAAGPVGQLFLLSANLRKLAFIGTGAWLFFLINVFKLPFQGYLGILSFGSLAISAALMPVAVAGALVAPRLVRYINEVWFLRLVWLFVIVAGVKLIFF